MVLLVAPSCIMVLLVAPSCIMNQINIHSQVSHIPLFSVLPHFLEPNSSIMHAIAGSRRRPGWHDLREIYSAKVNTIYILHQAHSITDLFWTVHDVRLAWTIHPVLHFSVGGAIMR